MCISLCIDPYVSLYLCICLSVYPVKAQIHAWESSTLCEDSGWPGRREDRDTPGEECTGTSIILLVCLFLKLVSCLLGDVYLFMKG